MFCGASGHRQSGYASSIQRLAKHGKRNGNSAARWATKADLARQRRAMQKLMSASWTNPDLCFSAHSQYYSSSYKSLAMGRIFSSHIPFSDSKYTDEVWLVFKDSQ